MPGWERGSDTSQGGYYSGRVLVQLQVVCKYIGLNFESYELHDFWVVLVRVEADGKLQTSYFRYILLGFIDRQCADVALLIGMTVWHVEHYFYINYIFVYNFQLI